MCRRIIVTALSAAVCLLFATPGAQAQTEDHLKCYKVKDPLRLKGLDAAGKTLRTWLDLTPQQFASFQENCKIVGGLRYFCAPVDKQVDPNAIIVGKLAGVAGAPWNPITPDPSFSGPAEGDKICYKIKCDNKYLTGNAADTLKIRDQFGEHVVDKIKPFLLCGPAKKDCLDSLTQQPGCGFGWCQNTTDVCQADPLGTGCICAPPGGANPPLCASAAAPTCNGLCPSGTVCQDTGAGICQCHCPSLQCTNVSPPMCANAWCPNPAETCVTTPSACQCFAAGACELSTPAPGGPGCGGTCPIPGDTCQVDDPNNPQLCVCAPAPPQPCSATLPPLCGGTCPPAQPFCVINDGVCQCQAEGDIVSNHYRLYAAFGPIDPPLVNLGDQFLPDLLADLDPLVYFAVPAFKDGEAPPYPGTHGTCYQIPQGNAFPADVSVVNQFGPQTLTIETLDFLFVPAQKIEPPGGPVERNEHYNCYRATGDDLNLPVLVLDQFSGPDQVTVRAPNWFCAPARKEIEQPEDELHHLTCYLTEDPGVAPILVGVDDQFAIEQIDVGLPLALCVPSFKESVEEPLP